MLTIHGELRESASAFQQDMNRVEGILSLFDEVKKEDINSMIISAIIEKQVM